MLIGDVARRSGVSARMLRHYETLGLVRPTGRTGSGYREYSDEDIRRIFHVESLRSLGVAQTVWFVITPELWLHIAVTVLALAHGWHLVA
ncbi:MerR family DNA-binding transcriptional regulator, partial [Streptomyces sp. NPDC000963]